MNVPDGKIGATLRDIEFGLKLTDLPSLFYAGAARRRRSGDRRVRHRFRREVDLSENVSSLCVSRLHTSVFFDR